MGLGILARFTRLDKEAVSCEDKLDLPRNEVEYLKLAEHAGFPGARVAIDRAKETIRINAFRRFLSENGITVYNAKAVERYMNSVTPNDSRWEWVSVGSYTKAIPEAVLMTMAKIRDAYPLAVFDVTEITWHPRAIDPFLRVALTRGPDYPWFIIERWDEPTFRE